MAKVPAAPTVNVAWSALVTVGAVPTFSVAAVLVAVPAAFVTTAR
jgi:hypothetical protein